MISSACRKTRILRIEFCAAIRIELRPSLGRPFGSATVGEFCATRPTRIRLSISKTNRSKLAATCGTRSPRACWLTRSSNFRELSPYFMEILQLSQITTDRYKGLLKNMLMPSAFRTPTRRLWKRIKQACSAIKRSSHMRKSMLLRRRHHRAQSLCSLPAHALPLNSVDQKGTDF